MSQHTPGPWSVNIDPNHHAGDPTIVWGPEGPGHGAVAYTFPSGLLLPDGQRQEVVANARLIASCPDLLEALHNLLEISLPFHQQTDAMAWTAIEEARKAISKALGESS